MLKSMSGLGRVSASLLHLKVPGSYETGFPSGLGKYDQRMFLSFHAGTAIHDGQLAGQGEYWCFSLG